MWNVGVIASCSAPSPRQHARPRQLRARARNGTNGTRGAELPASGEPAGKKIVSDPPGAKPISPRAASPDRMVRLHLANRRRKGKRMPITHCTKRGRPVAHCTQSFG